MNKYKNVSNNLTIKDGEAALTYGVKYIEAGELNSKIKPARPYFVIKRLGNTYYSLKLTTKDNKFLDNFKIEIDKYKRNNSVVKDSYVEMEHIYELEIGDFIQNGIVLTERDRMCIYNGLIKKYCLEFIDIKPELLSFVYKEYIKHKRIQPGTLLVTKAFDGQLLVLDIDDSYYKCLPVYRSGEEDFDEMIRFYKYNNYVNYSHIYYLPKSEITYISNFGINESLFNYIMSRVNEREKEEKGPILNKR